MGSITTKEQYFTYLTQVVNNRLSVPEKYATQEQRDQFLSKAELSLKRGWKVWAFWRLTEEMGFLLHIGPHCEGHIYTDEPRLSIWFERWYPSEGGGRPNPDGRRGSVVMNFSMVSSLTHVLNSYPEIVALPFVTQSRLVWPCAEES